MVVLVQSLEVEMGKGFDYIRHLLSLVNDALIITWLLHDK